VHKCNECNKEFGSGNALGGHRKSHSKSRFKTKKQIAYELNPKMCKECSKPISYSSYVEGYKPTFCSSSCRAIHQYKINPNNLTKNKQIEINSISGEDIKSV